MWAGYVPFYLCQRMRRLRWQRFLTLSQRQKEVVSYPPEVHLNLSKQLFLNFHFFHWLKLYLVKMAKLACDKLCQRMRRMRLQFASACGACGSKLLAQTAHTIEICQRTRRMWQQNRVKLCVLLAQTAHMVANCKRMRRMRQHFASETAHAVAICQRRRRMRQLKQNCQHLTHL